MNKRKIIMEMHQENKVKQKNEYNTIHGKYEPKCAKVAYGTQEFAEAAISLMKARGSKYSDKIAIECERCNRFHAINPDTIGRFEPQHLLTLKRDSETRIQFTKSIDKETGDFSVVVCQEFGDRYRTIIFFRRELNDVIDALLDAVGELPEEDELL